MEPFVRDSRIANGFYEGGIGTSARLPPRSAAKLRKDGGVRCRPFLARVCPPISRRQVRPDAKNEGRP